MKKIVFVTTFLLVLSTTTQAQLLRFGIKAGVNYANLTGSDIKTDAITNYHAGFVAEIKIIDKFSLQPELLYTTQGATYKDVLGDVKKEVGYIAIPVLLKIYLGDKISLELGPQASFLLSEKNKFYVTNPKTYDFSVAGGLGLKLTKNIFLQGRYVLGLTDATKEAKVRNSVVQVSAGIMF